jgi:hypothetical protein
MEGGASLVNGGWREKTEDRRQKAGVQEFRSSGVQESRSPGVQESRSSGVQEFRSSGVREFGSSGVRESRACIDHSGAAFD